MERDLMGSSTEVGIRIGRWANTPSIDSSSFHTISTIYFIQAFFPERSLRICYTTAQAVQF
ncbi:uncharacterized protein PGTG_21484 [Puccinia graminis f. sp. tritici CRL 75-36-700-3]|uniref:Uncharacterized protein n=1 Tax=Puccinia graminis f. sp. tritici (strain CRL 75-36-700-3 / race SCCL) TaxID=418459 RepID=H6QRT7_PUCGT|nr:uncharacterized protein PGTG_21484 [Puccinia graminis f. sp. tritici CRL 75-36-700-3]EHS63410.1 hypothetical protein PGTG_21484 [Puccinia graminis f. sp. tritici CRL 75-36-700-3]